MPYDIGASVLAHVSLPPLPPHMLFWVASGWPVLVVAVLLAAVVTKFVSRRASLPPALVRQRSNQGEPEPESLLAGTSLSLRLASGGADGLTMTGGSPAVNRSTHNKSYLMKAIAVCWSGFLHGYALMVTTVYEAASSPTTTVLPTTLPSLTGAGATWSTSAAVFSARGSSEAMATALAELRTTRE